jgi:hypothetical protein
MIVTQNYLDGDDEYNIFGREKAGHNHDNTL